MGIKQAIAAATTVAQLKVLYKDNVEELQVLQTRIAANTQLLASTREAIRMDTLMIDNYDRIGPLRELFHKRLGEIVRNMLTD